MRKTSSTIKCFIQHAEIFATRFAYYTKSKVEGIAKLSIIICCLFGSIVAAGQTKQYNGKLDRAFQYLLKYKNKPELLAKANTSELLKIKTLPIAEGVAKRFSGTLYDCIIHTDSIELLRKNGLMIRSVFTGFVTAGATIEQIESLSLSPYIKFIKSPGVDSLHNDISVASSGASLLHQGVLNNTAYTGKGVIVAVYDTGIDWDHPDFRNPTDPTKSRILAIWDQTIAPITGESSPSGFSYGVEYTQAQLNDELDGSPTGFVREKDLNGHGTHVAGTAAGNGRGVASLKHKGMAPDADIVIIKGGNVSFSESFIIDALTYLQNLSTTLGKPIVLNMSLGGHSGPHDGTRDYEKAVDNFTNSANGRVAVISSGNSNNTNIHTQQLLAPSATGSAVTISVPSVSTAEVNVFQFSMYAADDLGDLIVEVVPPGGGAPYTLTSQNTYDYSTDFYIGDALRLYLTNGLHTNNDKNYLSVSLTRETQNGASPGNPAGNWAITVKNSGVTTRNMHGWLDYVSTQFAGTQLVGGNSNYLVGSPGNATTAITVASYTARASWYTVNGAGGGLISTSPSQGDSIATYSSRGPRRDEFQKPDITANGQWVISALSSDAASVGNNLVVTNLYRVNSGTSMASPAVAGAVALLLQAKPDASAATIKSLIQNAALKDNFTEQFSATPNTAYGYGKLDVFKAAVTLFGCIPVERVTYKYDGREFSGNGGQFNMQNTRAGVRFTNSGIKKLGGVYVFLGTIVPNLRVEIRNNNAGVPGSTILATKDINNIDGNINRYSWNYIDFSDANLILQNNTDYFILVFPVTNGDEWRLGFDNSTASSARSVLSADNGATWTGHVTNFRIRSMVFSDAQSMTGAIVQNHATDTRNIQTSMQFQANCEAISNVMPNGPSPVAGIVTSKAWVQGAVPMHNDMPYVQRHYEITPATGATTATAHITLYFTQAEFDAYNSHPNTTLFLPANGSDAVGKANLRVEKMPGVSGNGTGYPSSYTATHILITPAAENIVWNAEYSRWEISFDVSGFSGFVVHTNTEPLPIRIEYFTAIRQNEQHLLNWKINCNNEAAQFEVERSGDGVIFEKIATINSTAFTCSEPYQYNDNLPLQGANYYRIKILEKNTGKVSYTDQLLLENIVSITNTIYPNILGRAEPLTINYVTDDKGAISVFDASGRKIYTQTIRRGRQQLSIPFSTNGVYLYTIFDNNGKMINRGRLTIL